MEGNGEGETAWLDLAAVLLRKREVGWVRVHDPPPPMHAQTPLYFRNRSLGAKHCEW